MDSTWEKFDSWYTSNGFSKYLHEDWKSKYTLFDLEDGTKYASFDLWRRRFHEVDPVDFGDFTLYRKGNEYHVDLTVISLNDDEEEAQFEEWHFDSELELVEWMLEELTYRDGKCDYLLCDFKEDV